MYIKQSYVDNHTILFSTATVNRTIDVPKIHIITKAGYAPNPMICARIQESGFRGQNEGNGVHHDNLFF